MRDETDRSAPRRPEGTIAVADQAIRSIVREAVMSSYGIVDMAPRSLGSAIGKRLGLGAEHRGIAVHVAGNAVTIELSVVVEYGTPIFTVAGNVMQTVKFHVERMLGMTVERVNVTVDGLRVSKPAQAAGRGA